MKLNFTPKSIIKRRISLCLAVICTVLLFGSCFDEPIYSECGNGEDVTVKVHLTIPIPPIAQTRSTSNPGDSYFNSNGVYLMVFANNESNIDNNQLLQITKATGSANLYSAQLKAYNSACYVYVIANAEDIISKNKVAWEQATTTLGTIKQALKFAVPTAPKKDGISEDETTVITKMVTPQPMMVEVALDKIDVGTQIGTNEHPELMTRSTVKITISNETIEDRDHGLYKETLYGANLIKAPVEGYLFPMDKQLLQQIKRHNTASGSDLNGFIAPVEKSESDEKESCTLYTFESVAGTAQGSTAVVIQATYKGVPYYYRMHLDIDNNDYALIRNFHYIVKIKNIKREGAPTMEEAIKQETADNIEYTVNVIDDTSADIITDGEYYMGLSNSEFYALADGELTNVKISTLKYNIPKSGSIEVIEEVGKISLVSNQTSLYACDNKNSPKNQEIEVNLGKDFERGTIRIIFDKNFQKDILVYKKPQPNKLGVLLTIYDFNKEEYISARVEENQDWLKLTTKKSTGDIDEAIDLSDRCESTKGGISVRIKANLGDNSSPEYRIGYVNFFRRDNIGNARILIKQEMHNVYEDIQKKVDEKPYTYIGTFHRHDQVAERIIRIDPKIAGGGQFKWRAFVIYGDFIRLSLDDSNDAINEDNFYGQGDNTNLFGYDLEEKNSGSQYLVINGTPEVRQEKATRIFFRVGLTSMISANSIRYGLIGLQTGADVDTEKITRYIFVRQGEEADYLMRKQDPILKEPGNEANSPGPYARRDKAVKISTFNLTDPDGFPIHSNLTGKKGRFTDYPSQGGYLYQCYSNQGWIADPYITHGGEGYQSLGKPIWSENYENCPKGYHRPDGGIESDNSALYDYRTDVTVAASSIRQSLWLYPKNGGISNTQNSIIGYLADGFYDRQPMKYEVNFKMSGEADCKQLVLVNQGGEVAFIGVLSFNPHNVASIFMPMTGYYANFMGFKRYNPGYEGSMWTRTRVGSESTSGGYYTVDYGYMYRSDESDITDANVLKFRVDNYKTHTSNFGFNIRCVKD